MDRGCPNNPVWRHRLSNVGLKRSQFGSLLHAPLFLVQRSEDDAALFFFFFLRLLIIQISMNFMFRGNRLMSMVIPPLNVSAGFFARVQGVLSRNSLLFNVLVSYNNARK